MLSHLNIINFLRDWYASPDGIFVTAKITNYMEKYFFTKPYGDYLQLGSPGFLEFSKSMGASNSILVENFKIPLTHHIVANMELLPIIEEYFNVVFLCHSFEYCEDLLVLLEAYRVLKPGGILVVIGFHHNRWKQVLEKIQVVDQVVPSHFDKKTPSKEIKMNLSVAGFKLIQERYISVKNNGILNSMGLNRIDRFLSSVLGDIYFYIAKKEVTNLDLLRNRNGIFSKNIISLPDSTAWD